jgi:hypothetical protein
MTVIEVDGINVEPYEVDQLQIYAGKHATLFHSLP